MDDYFFKLVKKPGINRLSGFFVFKFFDVLAKKMIINNGLVRPMIVEHGCLPCKMRV